MKRIFCNSSLEFIHRLQLTSNNFTRYLGRAFVYFMTPTMNGEYKLAAADIHHLAHLSGLSNCHFLTTLSMLQARPGKNAFPGTTPSSTEELNSFRSYCDREDLRL